MTTFAFLPAGPQGGAGVVVDAGVETGVAAEAITATPADQGVVSVGIVEAIVAAAAVGDLIAVAEEDGVVAVGSGGDGALASSVISSLPPAPQTRSPALPTRTSEPPVP